MQENFEYIIFCAATAVLFAALWALLPRLRKRARLPYGIVILATVFLIGNWWTVKRAEADARSRIEQVLESLAPTYAVELERMQHHKLTLQTAPDDPAYLETVKAIRDWQSVSQFAQDVYTVRKLPDGRNVFIVDPETDYDHDGKFEAEIEKRTPIGTEFTESDSGMELAFKGRPNFNPEVVQDEWGTWVGAWAPIRDAEGKVDAVVGVDFDAHQWLDAMSEARMEAIIRAGMLMMLLALGGVSIGLLRADNLSRREAEERSRRSEQRLALTLQQLPLAFIEWSTKGECIAWNPTAERIFGYRREDVLGQFLISKIVPPGAREHVDKLWINLVGQTGGTHSINDNVTKDGKTIVCEWYNTPITDPSGAIIGAFSLVQDITERINLEKHVQHAQRLNAVGHLAAGVAHDFNNILTIITGHAGLILDHPGIPPEVRTDLDQIEQAAVRASGLTRQLLAFSRQQAVFPRALHLGKVVEGSVSMLGRLLGEDVKFRVHVEPDLPAIDADPAMLDQVITNLVLNARDALPRGGTIKISVERANSDETTLKRHADAILGECVCLAVADNGTGIAPENLSMIFEPFFTTKQTGKGTGLGLSVVHGIVKQHHGWIDVESTPGRGSVFRLYFPPTSKVPEDAEKHVPAREVTTDSQRKKTILLAEDESMVRDLARMILERAGYRVIGASDGVQALALWSKHREEVDLLLTDMVMPNGVTGRDLSRRILADEPDLPIVYASGYSLELTAPDFQETDRQMFLQKPYRVDQLVATVRRCLGEGPHKLN